MIYGKIITDQLLRKNISDLELTEATRFNLFANGYLLIEEAPRPGLGYVASYKKDGKRGRIIETWSYSREQHIEDLKQKLRDTDYVIIKIAEGAAGKDEYSDVIAERQNYRKKINELQMQEE